MATFAEMRKAALLAIYRAASDVKVGPSQFTGKQLESLIASEVGSGFASAIFDDLHGDHLFTQTFAVTDETGGRWTLTAKFINEADRLLSEEQENSRDSAIDSGTDSYTKFKERLLVAMADYEDSHSAYNYEPAEVATQAGIGFKAGWVRKAVTSFGDYGYVRTAFTIGGGQDGGLSCALTGEGLEEVERIRNESVENAKSRHANLAFDGADLWTPLPLEVPSENREEIAEDLEGLRKDVKSSNGYASTYPAEHSNIVWALGSAVNGFREGLFTRYLLEMCVVRPLSRLIEMFPDAAIQIAAQSILVKIYEFFRGFLTDWGLL